MHVCMDIMYIFANVYVYVCIYVHVYICIYAHK